MARLFCLLYLLCVATCIGQSQQPEDGVSCDTAAGINCQHEESISEQQALLQTHEARLAKVQKKSVEDPDENKTFSNIGEPASAEPEDDNDEDDDGEDDGEGEDALLQEEAISAGGQKPEGTNDEPAFSDIGEPASAEPEDDDGEGGEALLQEDPAEDPESGPIEDIGEAVSEEGDDESFEQDTEVADPSFLEEDEWLKRIEDSAGQRIPAIN